MRHTARRDYASPPDQKCLFSGDAPGVGLSCPKLRVPRLCDASRPSGGLVSLCAGPAMRCRATWREIPGECPAAGSGECTGSGMPGSGVRHWHWLRCPAAGARLRLQVPGSGSGVRHWLRLRLRLRGARLRRYQVPGGNLLHRAGSSLCLCLKLCPVVPM